MKIWQRNGYTVEEREFDYDLHCFAVVQDGKEDQIITPGSIENMNSIIVDLDAGEDVNGWEDGMGNTIYTSNDESELTSTALEIIEELGKLPVSTINNLGKLQTELAEAGYVSYLDASTDYLIVEKSMNLTSLYKEWRELQAELELDGKYIDCGESSVRSDFSAFAKLGEVISFEEMLELEKAY